MTLTFDRSAYTDLLSQVTPKVIETEVEYEQTLAVVESLAFNQNRTAEQTALYKLLVLLVESYEVEYYPIPDASPVEVLNHILEASDTKPVDLVGLIGSSSVVSEILNGTRAISKAEAKILSDRFKVSPSLFIE
jgi:HTH-type transcriptional regulator/antitoxin HigA